MFEGMKDKYGMAKKMKDMQKKLKGQHVEIEGGKGAIKLVMNGNMEVVELKFVDRNSPEVTNLDKLEKNMQEVFDAGVKKAQMLGAQMMQQNGMGM